MNFLPHIASRVIGVPLMVERGRLETILSVLGSRIGMDTPMGMQANLQNQKPDNAPGQNPSGQKPVTPGDTQQMEPDEDDQDDHPDDRDRDRDYVVTPDGIAVLPIIGTLVKRVGALDTLSGISSRSGYRAIEAMILDASTDSQVTAILLEIDSPGGEVGGVFDLADTIRQARQIKPIWAVADDALSAAYLLASAAERIYTTQTSAIGSIGVIAVHVDESGADAKAGLKYTAVTAGARKNDFSSHEPLSKDAQATLQTEVDRLYSMFCKTVAANRGMTVDAVQSTEAAILFGNNAVSAGMADKIGNLRIALADLSASMAGEQPQPVTGTNNRPNGVQSPYDPAPYPATDDEQEGVPMVTQKPAAGQTAGQPQSQPVGQPPQQPNADAKKKKKNKCCNDDPNGGTNDATKEIVGMCALAGKSQLVGGFLLKGMTPAQVSKKLLAMRAKGEEGEGDEEITSHVSPHGGTSAAGYFSPETNPVVAAAKRIAGIK